MPVGDVWILGAGASAEAGAPTIAEFQQTAQEVAISTQLPEREVLDKVLDFWMERLPTFNIEELFGFVDSDVLGSVTGEGELGDMRRWTTFLIAKVITRSVKGPTSQVHIDFIKRHVEDFVPIITLNWDILLDNAILQRQRPISYVLPTTTHWNPSGRARGAAQKLLKLHGSLNWVHCGPGGCGRVTLLTEKEPIVSFLLEGQGIACESCGRSDSLEVLLIPPVLSKLDQANEMIRPVWKDAYGVLRDAKRVFIVGYSFPPTDIQTKLFISKALRENTKLEHIRVITRPKFGAERSQFEDRYVDSLRGSEQVDCLKFDYRTFGQFVIKD